MNGSGQERTTPSVKDGDGVRVIRERRSTMSAATIVTVLFAGTLVVAGIATLVLSPRPSRALAGQGSRGDSVPVAAAAAEAPVTSSGRIAVPPSRVPQRNIAAVQAMSSARPPDDLPSGDPNDIASYVSPGDPAPTMTEVIQALHDMGDHTGIGAFNPPGTSPLLQGLAVPEDFELPAGYVRHHQVTDEGEPLEPILMFSPDGTFVDASGHAIEIPEDRVVPPELAPPGLPIREITIPPAAMPQP